MTYDEAARIVARIDAVWPPKTPRTAAELDEWLTFLREFDSRLADRAIDELRTQLGWRPSMADFNSAYSVAVAMPEENLPALPAAAGQAKVALYDLYGVAKESWIYCWRCRQAITTEELATTARYDGRQGYYHAVCPPSGSGPGMPAAERLERSRRMGKNGS